jgi:hypothetical protein
LDNLLTRRGAGTARTGHEARRKTLSVTLPINM